MKKETLISFAAGFILGYNFKWLERAIYVIVILTLLGIILK